MAPTRAQRAIGQVTRGTTNPNRLRRVDRWILHAHCPMLRASADPVVVDLGFGADSITTVEMFQRLRAHVRPDVEVVGIEIDPERVSAAAADEQDGLTFRLGGFEIPLDGRSPALVRAFNVLRQYEEGEVGDAWARIVGRLQPGGVLIEGTCDELGRLATWADIRRPQDAGGNDSAGRRRVNGTSGEAIVPESLTFAAHLPTLERPGQFAERLPKALIHRNVPGEPVHDLLRTWDECWDRAAPHAVFGVRQRWIAAATALAETGRFDVRGGPHRWRLGEVSVRWPAGPVR